MTTAAADPKVEINTDSTDGLAEMLVSGVKSLEEKQKGNNPPPAGPSATLRDREQPAATTDKDDVTAAYQEKFTPIQKEGNIEAINKLREEIQKDITDGKKVDDAFLRQLELSAETPDQKKIREVTAQRDAIQNDLKLSEVEKTEALKKMEGTKEKKYWEDPEFSGDPITGKEKNESVTAQVPAEIADKAKKYDEIVNDSFYKAYKSALESGKSVPEFLTEISNGNPATLTDAQVLEKSIARAGLSDEEAIEQRDHFNSMSPIAKKDLLKKEREILNKDYQKNFEKFSTNNAAEKEKLHKAAEQAIKDTKSYLTNLQGKEVWGIQYDSTQISKLEAFATNLMENGLFKEDGTWDVPKIMRIGMKELNSQHMLQKAYEKGAYEKEEEMYQTYQRPSKNSGIGRTPDASVVNKQKSENAAHDEQWKKDVGITA